jgi:arylsulfatase A-like enzyme
MRRRSFLLAPFALAAAGRHKLAAAGRQTNVLLVIASGWRGQAVPWERDQNLIAPNLAQLGRESLTFPRTYSGYPRLIPGRRILLDGRFSHAALRQEIVLNESSLGARLKAAGYRTAAFGDRRADDVVSFVHTLSPQPFYVEWTDAFGSGFMERRNASELHLRPNVPAIGETAAREELAQFYSRCTARDTDLGLVLAALDRPELKDNTLVVFTSDRGEQMGSHAITGDDTPYEESVRIPLAMRHPLLGRPGERDVLVSGADIAPTLLALCDVPVPAEMQGRNLAPLITGAKVELPDAVFVEGRIGEADEWRMLVHGYDKLVTDVENRPTHLYNLVDDPYEMNNLVNVSAEELKRDATGALLQYWRRKLADGRDASGLKAR